MIMIKTKFDVLTVVNMKVTVVYSVTPYSLVVSIQISSSTILIKVVVRNFGNFLSSYIKATLVANTLILISLNICKI